MDLINIKINKENSNISIKDFLKKNNIGRGRIESIRVNKFSYINNEYKNIDTCLKEGNILSFVIDENIDFEIEEKEIEILYEDEYLLAINKPSGIIIHPDNKSKNGTLVNRVAEYYKRKCIKRNIRYIHRLDKETTGVVLFAKDFLSEGILLKDIEENKIKREYIALVKNCFNKQEGIIDAPIGKDRHINNKMIISKTGKKSITKYKVLKENNDFCKVLFTLNTGRTHQIRVHSAYIKHPLLGDTIYGNSSSLIDRCALHCYRLSFIHPITRNEIVIEAPIPKDMDL